MKLKNYMHILSDDDLSQVCGGIDESQINTIEFSVGLLFGPLVTVLSNFT